MGIGASSTAGLENPFPITPSQEKDLTRLAFVVSRILNTPDIYDLNNLGRPGACGDYAVFLKEKLEKRLLPFIADLSGESLAVVYQNPLKAFDSVETRKQVCQNLSTTMIQLVSIIVACTTSLQFESTRAKLALAASSTHGPGGGPGGVGHQKGGANESAIVIRWLQQNRYIPVGGLLTDSTMPGYYVSPLMNPAVASGAPERSQFRLKLKQNADPLEEVMKGYITSIDDSLPKGSLKVNFLRPIPIASGGSVLPLQVVDTTGLTWMCGVLNSYTFISLSPARKADYPFDILTSLYRRAAAGTASPVDKSIEDRAALDYADAVFAAGKQNPQQIVNALMGTGAPPPPRYGSSGFGSGGLAGGLGAGGFGAGEGVGGLGGFPMLPRRRQSIMPAGYRVGGDRDAFGAPATVGEYVIPPSAAKAIMTAFRKHAGELGAGNNPAQVRATLLAAQVLKDRTIQTRICQDPYWRTPNLAAVYPWATLQFLSVANVRELGSAPAPPPGGAAAAAVAKPIGATGAALDAAAALGVPPPVAVAGAGAGLDLLQAPQAALPPPLIPAAKKATKLAFHPEWKEFVDGLKSIYSREGLPTLMGEGELENLRFMDLAKVRGCSTVAGVSPRARFQEIQNGVLQLRKLYEEHAKAVWKLLNSLIYVIADPDRKQEIVRLNPGVFANPAKPTATFVGEKAAEARTLLVRYYLEVERTYTATILAMKLV